MKIRPWHVAGTLLVLCCAGLAAYALWPTDDAAGSGAADERPEVPSETAEVEVIVVDHQDFALRSEATGYLVPWREAEVSAEVGGLLTNRLVEEGSRVAEGALLLKLDERRDRLTLEEAEAAMLMARAEYAARVSGDLTTADTDTTELAALRVRLREAERQFEVDAISDSELRTIRDDFENAFVRSGGRRSAVQQVMAGVTQAESAVARARLQLQFTNIRAPFSGRVADIEVEAGQRVSAGQTVLRLLDDRRMKVDVAVMESEMVKMRPGASAVIRVPALGNRVFEGTIHSVNPAVDRDLGTGRVTVAVPNVDGRLVTGLFAYVALETERLARRLVVPSVALLVRQGRDLVFTVKDGRAQWTYVTVGARSGDQAEIVEGLAPGDHVAVTNHFALAHDAPVTETIVDAPVEGIEGLGGFGEEDSP
jgi:HlyD family secretion protein